MHRLGMKHFSKIIIALSIGLNGGIVNAQDFGGVESKQKTTAIVLTTRNLKDLVLNGNLNLMQAFMRVKQAEDRLHKARLDLLPSINIAAIMSGPAGIGAQAISTLPFLLPSNWFNLNANKDLRQAEILGLQSLALNTILNAEKNYFTLLRDQEVLQLLTEYKEKLADLGLRYEERNLKELKIDPVGLSLISGKTRTVESATQKTQELIATEKAEINRMLARREDFSLGQGHMPSTPFDTMTDYQIWDYLLKKPQPAPEMQQLQWLIKASKNSKWSQVFSFLGSASMSTPTSGTDFGQLTSSGSVNLGFGLIPLFSLGNHQVKEFEFQQRELGEEGWRIIRTAAATLQVTEAYETIYKHPIKLKTGETVNIEKRETNPDWLGWVYCIDSRGISGWVSEKYLQEFGETAIVVKDYDATELTASAGEQIKIYYEEFGWCWSSNKHGVKGWIPKKNLKVL